LPDLRSPRVAAKISAKLCAFSIVDCGRAAGVCFMAGLRKTIDNMEAAHEHNEADR
jgi:hypothetical protein